MELWKREARMLRSRVYFKFNNEWRIIKAFTWREDTIKAIDRKDASGQFVQIGSEGDRAGREYSNGKVGT